MLSAKEPFCGSPIQRSVPYFWAAAAVTMALGVRLLLGPFLGDNRPFLTFLAAVAIAAWLGGRSTAIFAIVLSYLVANYFFIPPYGGISFDHTSSAEWSNVLVFVGLAMCIVEPILAALRARREAEASAAEVARLLADARELALQKDRFLAALAHELRNPLSTIGSALSLWPHVNNDSVELDRLRSIMTRQTRMITRLVDDMMDMVRFDRGAMHLQKERVDMATLISHVVEAVQANLNLRGHQLHVDLPPEHIVVDGDVVRLTQVFLNIVDNAIKYTGRDGTISIAVRRQGNDAVVEIQDDGPGISETMLPTVFEIFSQAESTRDRSAGGLGIGLCLVKQLVTLHGGTVEAHSDGMGKGSKFTVTLAALPAQTTDGDGPLQLKHENSLACHRILVVDDVRDSADTLARTLCAMGHNAHSLYDGQARH